MAYRIEYNFSSAIDQPPLSERVLYRNDKIRKALYMSGVPLHFLKSTQAKHLTCKAHELCVGCSHRQLLLIAATALPQGFKHTWIGERHKYSMSSTTKTLKTKTNPEKVQVTQKINFLNENDTGLNRLKQFCSFPFRKTQKWHLLVQHIPTLKVCCVQSVKEQELYTNTTEHCVPTPTRGRNFQTIEF